MKTNKIYIKPYHSEVTAKDDGFILTITGKTKNGQGQEYKIIIAFDWWWIPFLLKGIKQVITSKINWLTGINNKINIEIK